MEVLFLVMKGRRCISVHKNATDAPSCPFFRPSGCGRPAGEDVFMENATLKSVAICNPQVRCWYEASVAVWVHQHHTLEGNYFSGPIPPTGSLQFYPGFQTSLVSLAFPMAVRDKRGVEPRLLHFVQLRSKSSWIWARMLSHGSDVCLDQTTLPWDCRIFRKLGSCVTLLRQLPDANTYTTWLTSHRP